MGRFSINKVSAILVTITLAVALILSILVFQQANHPQPEITQKTVFNLVLHFQEKNKPLDRFMFPILSEKSKDSELFQPESLFPFSDLQSLTRLQPFLKALENCGDWPSLPSLSKDAQLQKYEKWYRHHCFKEELADGVWSSPPRLHPFGGSWIHWLYQQGYKDKAWLRERREHLHLLERHLVLQDKDSLFDKIIADFKAQELKNLLNGKTLLQTENYFLILTHVEPDTLAYQAFSIETWDKYLKDNNLRASPVSNGACGFRDKNYCWSYIKMFKPLLSEKDLLKFLIFLLLLLSGFFLFTLWKRYREDLVFREQQQLVMQTLAHELRHPVTGLRLSIEAMRPFYDHFPEEVSEEFLRLAATSQRMTRIVSFSQSYLQLLMRDGQFHFRQDRVESFKDFIEVTLENYLEKIQLIHPQNDCACILDFYWVSTCVKNLVVNALTHGESPIEVRWQVEGQNVAIEVKDSGGKLKRELKELVDPQIKTSGSQGMGLGLSLVYRVIGLMGGALSLQKNPTRFTITLKGVIVEENIASRR